LTCIHVKSCHNALAVSISIRNGCLSFTASELKVCSTPDKVLYKAGCSGEELQSSVLAHERSNRNKA